MDNLLHWLYNVCVGLDLGFFSFIFAYYIFVHISSKWESHAYLFLSFIKHYYY